MKKLLLASALIASFVASSLPASAQYAGFTGDGIFGHDYRADAARRPAEAELSVGYAEEKAPETTGSARAVTTRRDDGDAGAERSVEARAADRVRR